MTHFTCTNNSIQYLCTRIREDAPLCNGSTPVFGTASQGSNPCGVTSFSQCDNSGIAPLCNGSTPVFGTASQGSNPCGVTKKASR